MALTTRQTNLLVQQDWTKVYQTFKEADFQSYDFETLRKTMIDYLRTYYPEDFNDFIESSEYIALIDLIAFLGQSLAFRGDLNARENFIDTAERRDSVLKLARMINYVPKRNIPASGLLKIDSVTTTENVTDSNGTDLSNLIISWNDNTNDNWQEQFNAILNAALLNSQVVGRPGNSQIINSVRVDEYTINVEAGTTPAYRFTSNIDGSDMTFEAVSVTSVNQTYIYEAEPRPTTRFNLLYRNDNLGNSSNNTGFFVYFKQGTLSTSDFSLQESLPNRSVSINVDNINNDDVWLYSINTQGVVNEYWKKVPAVSGINIAYNKSEDRNLYQINTRINDQIDLVFGDGSFANIPQGRFRLYHRQSNGLTYKITPDEMQNIVIPITYVSRSGRTETLTIRASLYYTIANATSRETLEEIRVKAPQQYYTQNRMITGEDYNIFPYTEFSTVLKVKAINRTSSGVSRFLDVLDVTGKYSSTNIYASDGILYRDEYIRNFQFDYQTTNEIFNVIYNQVRPLVADKSLQHFHYSNSIRPAINDIVWKQVGIGSNTSIGTLNDLSAVAQSIGSGTPGVLGWVTIGSMLRFSAGEGKYFTGSGKIVTGQPTRENDRRYIYAAVVNVDTDKKQVTLNQVVPTGAVPDLLIPVFKNSLSDSTIQEIANNIKVYNKFGLRYDSVSSDWKIVLAADISDKNYDPNSAGSDDDSTWLFKFEFNGQQYIVQYRGMDYYFESEAETKFYFDNQVKVFDSKTGKTINDHVNILRYNTEPDAPRALSNNMMWYVYKSIIESDGYENNNKVLVTFPDSDNDGVPDNPDLFELIVAPDTNTNDKNVFFQQINSVYGFNELRPVKSSTINSEFANEEEILISIDRFLPGQVFYTHQEDMFYRYIMSGGVVLEKLADHRRYVGRSNLAFQYRHNSPNQRRIDPSPNNIIDLFILTKTYANDYVSWIKDSSLSVSEPEAPTGEELKIEFSGLENYKTMSDTIIYNSAKFKPVFGSRADPALRAKFKVVKNPNLIISDSDIKTSVISAINAYFDISNWDFGETFYFSELSAYLHTKLSPDIASVVIVSGDSTIPFGSLYQINAEPDEIIISCATVDEVEIIPAITAAQLNQYSLTLNTR